MSAATVAAARGAARRCGRWWRCICPVHGSRNGRSATLALRDGARGLVVHCHAGCEAGDILAELRRLGLLGDCNDHLSATPLAADLRERERSIAMARHIWVSGRDGRGTPVEAFLVGRGIDMQLPPCLRFATSLRRADGSGGPAMLARIDNIDGELIGVHRTWLARDDAGIWQRIDRRMLGRASGGAVRLAPAADTLIIGEGIETVAAAMIMTGRPGWAALSTSGLAGLILPPCVQNVVITADNDANGAGERAARKAGLRWAGEGRRVRLLIPDRVGADANDVLRELRHAA